MIKIVKQKKKPEKIPHEAIRTNVRTSYDEHPMLQKSSYDKEEEDEEE